MLFFTLTLSFTEAFILPPPPLLKTLLNLAPDNSKLLYVFQWLQNMFRLYTIETIILFNVKKSCSVMIPQSFTPNQDISTGHPGMSTDHPLLSPISHKHTRGG